MKKLLAILLAALMLLCSVSALAEETIDWNDDLINLAQSIDSEAQFHPIANLGVMMWIPTNFKEIQLSEEDVNNGYIAYLITEDNSSAVAITYAEFEGTLGDMFETLEGMEDTKNVTKGYINGLPAVTFISEENDSFVVVFSTTGGYLLMFTFAPISDETFSTVGALMAASIQAVTE